jgi:uncharacterized phiE125 gp8 family phage protein
MAYLPEIVTAGAPLLTTDEAKAHCRIDASDEDDLIDGLIAAATTHVERVCGISLVATSWRLWLDDFESEVELPRKASSVTSVKFTDSADDESTVDASNYDLITDETGTSYIRFRDDYDFPTDLAEIQAVEIVFVAGAATSADVPPDLKHAVLLLVGHWYRNREAVDVGGFEELPLAVRALIGLHWSPTV